MFAIRLILFVLFVCVKQIQRMNRAALIKAIEDIGGSPFDNLDNITNKALSSFILEKIGEVQE